MSKMNSSRIVKGDLSYIAKLQSIQSAAEVELGRKLADDEIENLNTKYSVEQVYSNLTKVTLSIFIDIRTLYRNFSMVLDRFSSYFFSAESHSSSAPSHHIQYREMEIACCMVSV